VKVLFLIRLGLDFTTAGLLLVALAYYWLDNAIHEVIGTGIFLLLGSHNIFNRRWWGGIARQRREARNVITTAINLSLLVTMLTLLATSVIISETVFSLLPIRSDFTSRQVHAAAAYWALIIVAVHLGWHWHMITAVVATKLGITTPSRLRTSLLRAAALCLAAFGTASWLEVGLGSKLLMQTSLVGWDLATSIPAFFLHHVAIVGLCAATAHYAMMVLRRRKPGTPAAMSETAVNAGDR
jgi:hypothetical protein